MIGIAVREVNIMTKYFKNLAVLLAALTVPGSLRNPAMESGNIENTIAVHIRHIREKIEKDSREPRYIKVVWGIGYKMEGL